MARALPAFSVDKKGLAKILERREKSFVLLELIQNALDEESTFVSVTLEAIAGRAKVRVRVEDDNPDGFHDLAHAYTFFKPSPKQGQATKRGRFSSGEKFVLALCDTATITTTTGCVRFAGDQRSNGSARTDQGSVFEGQLTMTRRELEHTLQVARTVIVPDGVTLTINGEPIVARTPVAVFETPLPTEIAGSDGALRPTRRKCQVTVYDPMPGREATLYEMGIPVVSTGDRYDIDVAQKIPLSQDRDSVTRSYQRTLRVEVLNHTCGLLDANAAAESWVSDALEHPEITSQAINAVMDARFGAKRVIYDPSDPEGTKMSMAGGYTVIPGRTLTKAAWDNVRKHEAALPAGQVTPSPQPYSDDAPPLRLLDPELKTAGMDQIEAYACAVAERILNLDLQVTWADDPKWPVDATCGGSRLTWNVGRLGERFFADGATPEVNELLAHELAHAGPDGVMDHLDRAFADRVGRILALMLQVAIEDPAFYWGYVNTLATQPA